MPETTELIDGDGFGMSSAQDLDELKKALTMTYAEGAGKTGGDALRIESLEQSLKVLTFTANYAVLWQKIAKLPAYSTVEEFSQLVSYGSEGGSFLPAGTAPEEDDSTYARASSFVKYLGTTRKVSHPATLVRALGGDVIARENANGINKIIRDVEEGLFWGNRALAYNYPTVEGYEWSGLNNLIDTANILDLSNAALTEGDVEDAAEVVADNYGNPTDLFLSNKVQTAFTKTMLPKGRVIYPNPAGGLTAGAVVKDVETSYGTIALNRSKFLNTGRSPKKTVLGSASSTKAPTAPASIAGGAMAGATGRFRAAQQGDLKFQASACNRYGESAPTALSGAVTVGAGDLTKYIPLTITNANPATIAPEWFNIYCTEANGSTTYLVAQVAATSQANGGTTVYNYTGLIMPNTSIAFLGELSEQVIAFKQLAPLMKMDLAITDPNIRWMILLYGVMQLYATKKWMRIINIA